MTASDKPRDEIASEGGDAAATDERQARHELDLEAANRADIPAAGLGAAMSGEERPTQESETALSMKRAAGNARCV